MRLWKPSPPVLHLILPHLPPKILFVHSLPLTEIVDSFSFPLSDFSVLPTSFPTPLIGRANLLRSVKCCFFFAVFGIIFHI